MDRLEKITKEINENLGNYYFFLADSKNVPSASISYTYQMVSKMRENGYNAHILHEETYTKPTWMGGAYDKLPHQTLKGFKVNPSDFIILPEVFVQTFFTDLEKNKIKLPCEVVVLSQVYDLVFHNLDIGNHWAKWGIESVITTSNKQKEHLDQYMRGLNVEVVNPYITDEFTPHKEPQKPFVMVYTRDQMEGKKLQQMFFQKYPQYRWVTFKSVNKVDRQTFANNMKECCLTVWLDDISSFGTFPLESMKCGVPVLGKIPEMMPEWMGQDKDGVYNIKDNGMWVLSSNSIPDYIAKYIDAFFTDAIEDEIYEKMEETVSVYNEKNFETQLLNALENIKTRRVEKVKLIVEKQTKNLKIEK